MVNLNAHSVGPKAAQRGVALVVSLVFLLVVTIISVVAATNSKVGLTMASNMQESYESFQAAEAGVLAALATAGSDDDIFVGVDVKTDVFSGFADDEGPLGHVRSGSSSVTVNSLRTRYEGTCPRIPEGFSEELISCDFYRVDSEHEVPRRAKTTVSQGIIRTTIDDTN